MAPHSSTLVWKIPWMEEPGRLQSMGSLRVRHDWVTSLSLFTFMHWRRKWQPTPVFLPGESQEWGILVGCHLWGRRESDTTEVTQQQQHTYFVLPLWLRWCWICLQCRRLRFDHWVRKISWRREWLPSPVFLRWESHGQRFLVGYSPWGQRVKHNWVTNTN